jgi:NADPH2 dehydrogenase
MSSATLLKLFQPVNVGTMSLAHRVVMAPMTRYRANINYAHGDLGLEYYSQRAGVPGSFIVTEGTIIDPRAGPGPQTVPHISTSDQIQGWKRVSVQLRNHCYRMHSIVSCCRLPKLYIRKALSSTLSFGH